MLKKAYIEVITVCQVLNVRNEKKDKTSFLRVQFLLAYSFLSSNFSFVFDAIVGVDLLLAADIAS
jgi:hypothetical protein